MIPVTCDSLKGMAANWQYGVKTIPVIHVAYAQNRKIAAGVEFTASQLRKIKGQLEEIAGRTVTDADIAEAVKVYNENRAALRAFTAAAAKHPEAVTPTERSAVIKAGYFMDRAAHTEALYEITSALNAMPVCAWDGIKVVTSGIIADSPALLKILEEQHIAIVDDQVAHESGFFRYDTAVTEDPILGMAQRLGDIEGTSVLYDPGKQRGKQLVELAKAAKADGILWVMTKFCDPEEYDYVPVRRMIDAAGIPLLAVEVDQQMVNYEQARSAVQAFAEMIGK